MCFVDRFAALLAYSMVHAQACVPLFSGKPLHCPPVCRPSILSKRSWFEHFAEAADAVGIPVCLSLAGKLKQLGPAGPLVEVQRHASERTRMCNTHAASCSSHIAVHAHCAPGLRPTAHGLTPSPPLHNTTHSH